MAMAAMMARWRPDMAADQASPPDTSTERRAALGLLAHSAAPDAPVLRGAMAWLLLAAGLEALGPVLGKALIDGHLLPHLGQRVPVDLPAELLQIGGLLAGALLAGWLAAGLRYWQLVRLAGVAMRSVQRLRGRVYSHVLRLPLAYFDRSMSGQLVSRITNDTEAVKALYVQMLFVMLDSLIMLAITFGAMAWLDWRLMAVALLLVPAVLVIVWAYQRWSAPAVTRTRALRSDINAQTAESIAGMAVIQASSASARFAQRYAATNAAHLVSRQDELRANAWLLRPALDFLKLLLMAAVIGVVGWRTGAFSLAGNAAAIAATAATTLEPLAVGVLYAFVSYIARVVEPLIQITMQFSQLQQAVVAAARLNTLLQEAQAASVVADPGAPHASPTISTGHISVNTLHFGYQPGRPVLHGLNLDIPAGQFVGIVGHTGSGKSTLLSLLLRFYPAPAGALWVDGHDINTLPDSEMHRTMGLVPQEPFLLAASAHDNITMGRPLGAAAVQAAADAAGASAVISRLPQGGATPLGEGGARLSVGEKQLIAVARALAGAPRILLLDEATAHIDSETETRVQQALAALHGRVTVVAVAHRLSTIQGADQIIVLDHGRIAERGKHADLMAIDGGIYQRLVLLQQLAADDDTAITQPPSRPNSV